MTVNNTLLINLTACAITLTVLLLVFNEFIGSYSYVNNTEAKLNVAQLTAEK